MCIHRLALVDWMLLQPFRDLNPKSYQCVFLCLSYVSSIFLNEMFECHQVESCRQQMTMQLLTKSKLLTWATFELKDFLASPGLRCLQNATWQALERGAEWKEESWQ